MSFRLQFASDVQRNGLGLLNEQGEVVAEVFRRDATNSLEVSLFQTDLPFVQAEQLIRLARDELGPFEDGTLLPSALALHNANYYEETITR